VSWTRAENLHLTLFFLGDVTPNRLDRVVSALDATVPLFSSFSMSVEGIGTFGSPRSPRIVWVGVPDPSPVLVDLYGAIVDQLEPLGFEREDRPFRPHITVGRVRAKDRVAELTRELDRATTTGFGVVHVERVVVMQSHLHPQGPVYEVRHVSALKGA
jgi:2'-5' RNA ligase